MAKQSLDDVTIKLTSTSTKGFLFNAYNAKNEVSYIGEISQDHESDSCTCMGNTMGFVCKHIKKAHKQMEGFW